MFLCLPIVCLFSFLISLCVYVCMYVMYVCYVCMYEIQVVVVWCRLEHLAPRGEKILGDVRHEGHSPLKKWHRLQGRKHALDERSEASFPGAGWHAFSGELQDPED